MKSVFTSAFAYRAAESTAIVGQIDQDDHCRTLVCVSGNFIVRTNPARKTRKLSFSGNIDFTRMYSAYLARDAVQNALNPISNIFETLAPKGPIDTFVSISTAADPIASIDTRKNEVAVIIVGANANRLCQELKLGQTFLRPLDRQRSRIVLLRRFREFGLEETTPKPTTPSFDVAGRQPTREVASQQMYASEADRRIPDQQI